MQQPPNVPHGSGLEVWHGFAVSTILATLAAIKLWLNRKKPNADIHESIARTKRTDAETRKLDAEAGKTFGEVVLEFANALTEANQAMADQGARHATQLLHREKQEEAARRRAHDIADELNRAVGVIKHYEIAMTEARIEFVPFQVKTFKEQRVSECEP